MFLFTILPILFVLLYVVFVCDHRYVRAYITSSCIKVRLYAFGNHPDQPVKKELWYTAGKRMLKGWWHGYNRRIIRFIVCFMDW